MIDGVEPLACQWVSPRRRTAGADPPGTDRGPSGRFVGI